MGSPMLVAEGQQYNIGEKPIVILYTYINCHAGTPKQGRKAHYSIFYLRTKGYNNRLIKNIS